MTERPTTPGSGGFVPVNLDSTLRFAPALSDLSLLHPSPHSIADVPQAVLVRPTAESPREAALPMAQERAARRFAAWLADPAQRPAYRIARRAGQPTAIAAALSCPDLFLIDTPLGQERLDAIVALVEGARASGQRLAILTATPENANAVVLALPPEGLGRAKAEREPELPPVVAEQTARVLALAEWRGRRSLLLSQQRDLARQLKWWTEWSRLADEEATLAAAGDELNPPDEAALAFAAFWKQSEAECVARAEVRKIRDGTDAAARSEIVAEIEELRMSAPATGSGLGGFMKKMFGGAAPSPKLAAAEAKLRDFDATLAARNKPDDDADAEERTHCERLRTRESDRVRAIHAERFARLHRERNALNATRPAPSCEQLRAAHAELELTLADSDAPSAVPHRETIQKLTVVVGPLASLDSDPFFAPTHPETEPPFDRVLFADAEDMTPADFARAARLADARTMLGCSDLPRPAYRNGKAGRGEFFRDTFEAVDTSPWRSEPGRTVALFEKADARSLRAEPLADNPGIELRFRDGPDGQTELAEVAFPAAVALAEIKRFLLAELGSAKAHFLGEPEWTEDAEAIRCTWPGAEGTAFELSPGIRETIAGNETLGFQFAGWTRPAAEEWFQEHFGSIPATRAVRLAPSR